MSTSPDGSDDLPEPGASASGCPGFPAGVLLDTTAQIGHCVNETTARGKTRSGRPIEVSFLVVDPPGLSRCVVNCPDLGSNTGASATVTGADGAFILIRVFFPRRHGKSHFDVFVYSASSLSLLLIPEPYPVDLLFDYVGVLSCGDVSEYCSVVLPERQFDADGQMRYDLRVFSSITKSWSTKVTLVDFESEMYYGMFEPSRVFSVGGDSLAWVDLRNGILLCNELEKDPVMHFIKLPRLMPSNIASYGLRSDGRDPPLDQIRDVTCNNGCFRFVELELVGTSCPNCSVTVFERKPGSVDWDTCCTFPITGLEDVSAMDISYPTLDAYGNDFVFMIAKRNVNDPDVHFRRSYLQCAFPKHLAKAPGTHTFIELKGTISRTIPFHLVNFVYSVLVAKKELTHVERNSTSQLFGGRGSTLHLLVEQLAEYVNGHGLGKVAYDSVDLLQFVSEELDLYCKDPSAAASYHTTMRCQIQAAIEALDNLLRIVPSDVLDRGQIMFSVASTADKEYVDKSSVADKLAS
ncbi:hypothetical protein QOZ80_7AG0574690 [Eleusine coracana subsp. coracana]|nr:hypothetical protein QOZ80_7AG0574690 [Eleusine coracana subsp. coracana]